MVIFHVGAVTVLLRETLITQEQHGIEIELFGGGIKFKRMFLDIETC